jgi:hypothetical protein
MSVRDHKKRAVVKSLLWATLVGLGVGCAGVSEGVSGDEGAVRGAQPSSSCVQLLALLSEENKQPLLPKYGPGGSCWTGSRSEAKQCEESCSRQVSDFLHNAVKRNRESS